jgi:hypothetical protein
MPDLVFSMKRLSATLTSHADQPLASTTFALPPVLLIDFDPHAQKPAYPETQKPKAWRLITAISDKLYANHPYEHGLLNPLTAAQYYLRGLA